MEKEFICQTTLDQMVGDEQSQLLKASIPYLPPTGRALLSIYAKAKELQNTFALFHASQNEMQMCSAAPSSAPMEMLDDIRRFCYGESRNRLDQVIRVMGMAQMFQIMNETTNRKDISHES